MKKVKIKNIKTDDVIDWYKGQWVQDKNNPNRIVLTTGLHTKNTFCGMALPSKHETNGYYASDWYKPSFRILTTEIPFIISNAD